MLIISSKTAMSNTRYLNTLYESHIPTNLFQKGLLALGSAVISLSNPRRDDMVATLGEVIGHQSLKYMERKMKSTKEGLEILRNKPVLNSTTINFAYLRSLPLGTFGRSYADWIDKNKVTPDSRKPVHFVDDIELSYVMQRYRETHDLLHTILGMPTNLLGEVCVKWVEAIQFGLPMCLLASVFGPFKFSPKQRKKYIEHYLLWSIKSGFESNFLLGIYFEKYWEEPLISLRQKFKIRDPPKVK